MLNRHEQAALSTLAIGDPPPEFVITWARRRFRELRQQGLPVDHPSVLRVKAMKAEAHKNLRNS